jgi:predicted enzyme related to lactoylglutathione lyase
MAHPVVHFEIGCKDKEKTSEFYRRVFGWAIDPALWV